MSLTTAKPARCRRTRLYHDTALSELNGAARSLARTPRGGLNCNWPPCAWKTPRRKPRRCPCAHHCNRKRHVRIHEQLLARRRQPAGGENQTHQGTHGRKRPTRARCTEHDLHNRGINHQEKYGNCRVSMVFRAGRPWESASGQRQGNDTCEERQLRDLHSLSARHVTACPRTVNTGRDAEHHEPAKTKDTYRKRAPEIPASHMLLPE